MALLKNPLVLLKSDKTPVAVLKPPLVSLNRARRPVAVFWLPEVSKCLETSAGVPDPGGPADEHPDTFAIVGTGYVTVRVGTYRLRHRCKRKTDKQ